VRSIGRRIRLAATVVIVVGCAPAADDKRPSPSPDARPALARVGALKGGVRVRIFGTLEWVSATQEMTLARGDFVWTDQGAGAEIVYMDGMDFNVGSDTLFLIEDTPSLRAGSMRFDGQRKARDKASSISAPNLVWSDSVDTPEPPAGGMTIDRGGDGSVDQIRGRGRVDTSAGERIDLGANERVRVDKSGKASAKLVLPPPPVLLAPPLGATLAYADPHQALTVLKWRPVPGAIAYHMMVDDDAWFTEPLLDRAGIVGTSLELPGLGVGKYYWRVSAVDARKTEGTFSDFARFTVTAVATGPKLVIESIEVRKNVAQIRGHTEPGTSITVNGQRVDVREDGSFSEFVTLAALGRQRLIIRAEGARGAVTTEERSVLIESF
jgi:hypothetical protein